MGATEKLLTVDEFQQLPEPPEGGKMELVDGQVVVLAPVSGGHGKRASRLDRVLGAFVDEHGIGTVMVETGFLVRRNPDLVHSPDVSFLSIEMEPPGGIPEDSCVPGPPTLAIEVVSPSDRDADVMRKLQEYMQAGTQRVWLVRGSTRTVAVHRPDGSAQVHGVDSTLSSDDAGFAVEGFEFQIAQVFA